MMIDVSVASTATSAAEAAIPVATAAGARILAKAATATAPENPTVLDPACLSTLALEYFAELKPGAKIITKDRPDFKDGGYTDLAQTAGQDFEELADVVLNSSTALYAGTAADTILRAWRQLKPGGFGYLLVRHSTLSRSLPGTLRQQLRANGHIPVVIHLPNGLLEGTEADCFLLVLSKERHQGTTIVIETTREENIEEKVARWVEDALAPEPKVLALYYRTKQWAEGARPWLGSNLVEVHSWAATGGFDYAERSGNLFEIARAGFLRPPVSAEERKLEFEAMDWRYGYLKDVEAYVESAVREYVTYTRGGAVDSDIPLKKDREREIRRHFALPHLQEGYLGRRSS